MRAARFEVYRGGTWKTTWPGRWYWRLRAANGLVIADGSEGYATRSNALRAARRAIDTALGAEHSLYAEGRS